jgi:hypothetical protein
LAWEAITLDAICVVEQTGNMYWQHIYTTFHQNKQVGFEDHSQGALSHICHTILEKCTKWSAIIAHAKHLNSSGAIVKTRYKLDFFYFIGYIYWNVLSSNISFFVATYATRDLLAKIGNFAKPFVLHHCWKLLEHADKWKMRGDMPVWSRRATLVTHLWRLKMCELNHWIVMMMQREVLL